MSMMERLPDELKREIIRFIPRNDTAQLIHDSKSLSLKYVRRYMFQTNEHYEQRIWSELKPSRTMSVFYGDIRRIRRTTISLGQRVMLRSHGIIQ